MMKLTEKQIEYIRKQPKVQNWEYLLKKYSFPESVLEEFSEYFFDRKKMLGR